MTAARVVVLGEPLIGFVATRGGPLGDGAELAMFVVGAETNVAVGLERLGVGAAVVARVGDDGLGRTVLRALRAEGVDATHVRVVPGFTGALVRDRRAFGPSSVTYLRAGSAGSGLDADDVRQARASIEAADWLHLSGVTLALSPSSRAAALAALELAREAGTPVSFDLNYRAQLWSVEEARQVVRSVCAESRLVFAGRREALSLTGRTDIDEATAEIMAWGPGEAVVKRGAEGATHHARDGAVTRCPGRPVATPVDVVGSGDGFAAGYLAAAIEGADTRTRLDWGIAAGAFAVSCLGDSTGLPTREELDRVIGGAETSQVIR